MKAIIAIILTKREYIGVALLGCASVSEVLQNMELKCEPRRNAVMFNCDLFICSNVCGRRAYRSWMELEDAHSRNLLINRVIRSSSSIRDRMDWNSVLICDLERDCFIFFATSNVGACGSVQHIQAVQYNPLGADDKDTIYNRCIWMLHVRYFEIHS